MLLILSEFTSQTVMAPGTVTPVAPSCINIPTMKGCHAQDYRSKRYPHTASLTAHRYTQTRRHLCTCLNRGSRQRVSLPTQIAACQTLASKSGYTVPDSHVFTDEMSGTTLARPGLQQVRDLITRRAIAALVVYDPDRLSRNLGHQLLMTEQAEKAGVALLIVSHPLEHGPEGWLFFQMRGALAEYERAKILERMKRGAVGRIQAGHPWGGSVPLGYRYVPAPHGGHWEIDAEEAALVRRIFQLCVEGVPTRRIALILTSEHIPTPADRDPKRSGLANRLARESGAINRSAKY
jgi:DNA invertase Pin-like site-specific DNA recombinase